MPSLSVFLITKNEAHDLPACLESVRPLASEIIVVDDQSTDETRDIAARAGAKVFEKAMNGFGPQKQFALEQTTGDWVLSIDADERLTPALTDEIRQVMENPKADGYEVHRDFYFLGHRLRFGGLGNDWVLRLFRRGKGRFSDAPVHERVLINSSVARLTHSLAHYSYATLNEYLEKCDAYTTLAATEQWRKGRRYSWLDHLRPGWEVFSRVVLRGAWLDGQAGLIYAGLSSHAAWLRAVKLWEIQNQNRS